MKKAIVIGASSGIGEELAKVLSNEGYIVGLVARRTKKLLALQKKLPLKSFIKCIDISHIIVNLSGFAMLQKPLFLIT